MREQFHQQNHGFVGIIIQPQNSVAKCFAEKVTTCITLKNNTVLLQNLLQLHINIRFVDGFSIILPKNRANGLVKKSFNFNTRYDKTNPTQILA